MYNTILYNKQQLNECKNGAKKLVGNSCLANEQQIFVMLWKLVEIVLGARIFFLSPLLPTVGFYSVMIFFNSFVIAQSVQTPSN